jgi:hypothetical protein
MRRLLRALQLQRQQPDRARPRSLLMSSGQVLGFGQESLMATRQPYSRLRARLLGSLSISSFRPSVGGLKDLSLAHPLIKSNISIDKRTIKTCGNFVDREVPWFRRRAKCGSKRGRRAETGRSCAPRRRYKFVGQGLTKKGPSFPTDPWSQSISTGERMK